jgi:hypothetical protein
MYSVKRKFAATKRRIMFRRIFVLLLLLVFVFLILWVTGAIRLKSGPVRNLETLPFSSG